MFNPGEERVFTPGDGGDGDGTPGNPWDRDEGMSTPNDDGDPVDPLTGFGGGSDPSDPDNDGDGGPFDDGLYRPNPEDVDGTGLSSVDVKNFSDVSETSSTMAFVAMMSAEIAMI